MSEETAKALLDTLDEQELAIKRLRLALKDCADDLEAFVEREYRHDGKIHPANAIRYKRDIAPVEAARAALDDSEGF